MAGLIHRIRAFWTKDDAARVEESAIPGEVDPDTMTEDYESIKDDSTIPGAYISSGGVTPDFERDSERPNY